MLLYYNHVLSHHSFHCTVRYGMIPYGTGIIAYITSSTQCLTRSTMRTLQVRYHKWEKKKRIKWRKKGKNKKKRKKSQHHRAFPAFPKVVTRLVVSRMEEVFPLSFFFFSFPPFTFYLSSYFFSSFLYPLSPLAFPFHSLSANQIRIRGVNIIITIRFKI